MLSRKWFAAVLGLLIVALTIVWLIYWASPTHPTVPNYDWAWLDVRGNQFALRASKLSEITEYIDAERTKIKWSPSGIGPDPECTIQFVKAYGDKREYMGIFGFYCSIGRNSIVFANGEQYWHGFGQLHVIDQLCLLIKRVDSPENLVDGLSIPDAEAQVVSLRRLATKAASKPWFEKILRDHDDRFDSRTKEIAAKLALQLE